MKNKYLDNLISVLPLITSIIISIVLILFSGVSYSETMSNTSAPRIEIKTISLDVNHTQLIKLPGFAKRVSVGSAEIADVIMITPDQLYINALKIGSTNISIWDKNDKLMGVFEIRVKRDLTRLKERLHQVLPGEQIEVRELEGKVILSGRATSIRAKATAEAIAKVFSPEGVTSVIEIGGLQQVMLEVKIAEVARRVIKNLSVNLLYQNSSGGYFMTLLDRIYNPTDLVDGLNSFGTSFTFSNNMSSLGGFPIGNSKITGFLDALKKNGLATVLAEPNLIASSGQKASFLAGGEFPVPVPQKDSITVMFKQFGVKLNFTPEVLSNGRVRLDVEPEVSEVDFNTAVVVQGFTIPGLTTRTAKTRLELDDGQSFTIAGLLRDDFTQTIAKVPVLGDIPILGALFRSTKYQNKKTDLLIVVTPKIVKDKSTYAGKRLPTDGLSVPNDWQLYLEGAMVKVPEFKRPNTDEVSAQPMLPQSLEELEGKFGHEWID